MLVRAGLKQVLAEEYRGVVFGEIRTAQGLVQIEKHRWEVAILDASHLVYDRFSALQEILRQMPLLRLLTVRADGDSDCTTCASRLCMNCVSTNVSRSALVKAFKNVIAGGSYLDQLSAKRLPASSQMATKTKRVSLSAREQKVLLALAAGKRTGEIAAEWNLSIKTVSTYKHRVLEKLELKSTADLVRYVIRKRLA